MITVVLQSGQERRRLVSTAVEALGDNFFDRLKQARTVFVKVDLSHHERQLASTHVDAVRGLLDVIFLHARPEVMVGDGGFTGTISAFRNFGYDRLPAEYPHISLVDLNTDTFVEGGVLRADGSTIPIHRSHTATTSDLRISLTPMKIHRDYGVSLSVLNWVLGTWIVPPRISPRGLVYARSPWLAEGVATAHRSLMELWRQCACDVGIIDGIDAMEGDGPIDGTPLAFNAVLAGMDPVAVDAVGSAMMDIEPDQIPYLVLCEQERLGTVSLGHINIPPIQLLQHKYHFARPLGFEETLQSGFIV